MNTKITSLLTSAVLTGMLASQAAQAGNHKKGHKDHKGECSAEQKAKMKKDGKGECCGKGEHSGCGEKGGCGMTSDKATTPEGEAPATPPPADAAPAGKGK